MLVVTGRAFCCFSQGTLNFANLAADVDAQIRAPGCSDPVYTTSSGSIWRAELYYGPVGAPECLLKPSSMPGVVNTGSIIHNGYFDAGTIAIDGFLPGETITTQVRVWDETIGHTWDQVVRVLAPTNMVGASSLFQVTLSSPWEESQDLTGLKSFCLYFAELTEPHPSLRVTSPTTNNIVLTWPGGARDNFLVQQASAIDFTNWITIRNDPWTDWKQKQLALPTPADNRFFRLILNQ